MEELDSLENSSDVHGQIGVDPIDRDVLSNPIRCVQLAEQF